VRAGDYYTDGTAALSNNVRLWAGSTSRVEQGAVGCRCDEALAFRASHQLTNVRLELRSTPDVLVVDTVGY
jgi:hypothetical protein